ncbi:MAG: AMP-binding protein, partial [bacterium]|nr:AMP-binding protein [bacterium]
RNYYALSAAQKRMYILHQLEPGSTRYNKLRIFSLGERLEPGRLEQVFRRLIQRHETLRTAFKAIAGEPIQQIHGDVPFNLRRQKAGEGEIEEIVADFSRPFELSRPPLLRVGLIDTQSSRQIMMIDMHHITSDGVSTGLLVKEFKTLYDGKELLPLKLQYKDYAQWQNSEKEKKSVKRQESFWLNRFSGEIPRLNLPTDYERKSIRSFDGGIMELKPDAASAAALKDLAATEETTFFMILLAVFNVLLYKICGDEDIIVGSPVAGRRHADLENIIGLFVNTLPLRNFPSGEKTFLEFLRELTRHTLEAFENQDYQFEDLVDAVAVERDTARNPLFDVMLNVLNQADYEAETAIRGMEDTDDYGNRHRTSKFDILLTAVEIGDKQVLLIEYAKALFKPDTISRWLGYFEKIITGVCKKPTLELRELDILPEEEKKMLLEGFNQTRQDYLKGNSIHEYFTRQAGKTTTYIAVEAKEEIRGHLSLSYGELDKKSRQLARRLRYKGVTNGSIVAIAAERSLESIVGIMAILKTGAAYL